MKYLPVLLLLCGCMFKDGHYVQDNPVEEIAEAVLDAKTGIDVDFSYNSPEEPPGCQCKQRPKVELVK